MFWFETLEKYVRALNINSKYPIFAFVADKTILRGNLPKRQIFSNCCCCHLNDAYPNTLFFITALNPKIGATFFSGLVLKLLNPHQRHNLNPHPHPTFFCQPHFMCSGMGHGYLSVRWLSLLLASVAAFRQGIFSGP